MNKLTPGIKLSEVIQRVGSESPPFFKKLRMYAWIASLAIPAITGAFYTAGITIPVYIVIVVSALSTFCAGVASSSHLPTTDKNIQEKSLEINTKK
jgi:hypothetical protein